VAHGQQVVRVDKEERLVLTEAEEAKIVDAFEKAIQDADLAILSDYGKGFLSNAVIEAMIEISAAHSTYVFVDPKGKDYSKYKNATLLTPNRKEEAEATGLHEEDADLINRAGELLLTTNNIQSVLITQGEHGMTLFSTGEEPFHIPATSVETYDVTGAGDTVIATIWVARAAGLELRESAIIANAAAGEVVQHVGTTAITLNALQNALNR
jgi:D-beta-D-heptose 7-phosphate kinase/D-beta-D-heptose 1-phosphate adenosyltransferase